MLTAEFEDFNSNNNDNTNYDLEVEEVNIKTTFNHPSLNISYSIKDTKDPFNILTD